MKLITDSTADLPSELVERYNIEIVPLKIHLGEETYMDYYGIAPDEFYRLLRSTELFPTTTQPSPQDFVEVYRRLAEEDNCLISVHISSKLSGTYQSAMIARQQFPDIKIHVVDSRQASLGLGMIVLAAAKAIEAGEGVDRVLSLIGRLSQKIRTYFSVDSLEYLHRGGRIGRAQAFLGTMMRIKPLLELRDGEVYPVERIRGQQRLVRRMAQLVRDAAEAGALKVGLICTDNEEVFSMLSQQLAQIGNLELEYIGKVGGIITSHVGPGAIGVSYYPAL